MEAVPRLPKTLLTVASTAVAIAVTAGCGSGSDSTTAGTNTDSAVSGSPSPSPHRSPPRLRHGVPPSLNPHDIYAADRAGRLAPAVRTYPARVYVPNSESNTVSVIDPHTYKVIDEFPVGALPQHVTPSYDLKTLWVDNDEGNSLTPIDPATGHPGKPVPVTDPYNLYFTPDGGTRSWLPNGCSASTSATPIRCASSAAAGPLSGGRPHGLHRRWPLSCSPAASSEQS